MPDEREDHHGGNAGDGAGPANTSTTVLIADDHAVVRAGLRLLLDSEPDLVVVALAENGTRAVELAREHQPDVVLMDMSMPGLDGVGATRAIVAERPEALVVVLTSFGDGDGVRAAIDAGAVGYLLKDSDPEEIVRAVRGVVTGDSPLDPRVARVLLRDRTAGAGAELPTVDLTPRELEVLRLVARGNPNKLIARDLGISEKTVKAHLTRIFAALGVSDRTQAAIAARDRGLA